MPRGSSANRKITFNGLRKFRKSKKERFGICGSSASEKKRFGICGSSANRKKSVLAFAEVPQAKKNVSAFAEVPQAFPKTVLSVTQTPKQAQKGMYMRMFRIAASLPVGEESSQHPV